MSDPRILSEWSLDTCLRAMAAESPLSSAELRAHIAALTEERDRLQERNAKLELVAKAATRYIDANPDHEPVENLEAYLELDTALAALEGTPNAAAEVAREREEGT